MPARAVKPPVVDGVQISATSEPTWTWTSGGGGAGKFRYQLGGTEPAKWVELAVGAPQSFTTKPLADGTYTLYVQESEIAEPKDPSHWSLAGSFTIEVNAVAPATPTMTCPARSNDPIPVFSWIGDQPSSRYSVSLDGKAAQEITTASYTPDTNLSDGAHTLTVKTIDHFNRESQSASCTVTVAKNGLTQGDVIGGGVARIAISGTLVLVAHSSYLESYSIADRAHPRLLGRVSPYGGAYRGIAISGNYAYVGGEHGFSVVNVEDPSNMQIMAHFSTGYSNDVEGIAATGNLVFLVEDYGEGIRVIDVSRPTSPTQIGSYLLGETNYSDRVDLIVKGTTLFYSRWDDSKVLELDITDPRNITLKQKYLDPNDFSLDGESLVVTDTHIFFLSPFLDGMHVFERGGDPTVSADIKGPKGKAMQAAGNRILVGTDYSGVAVYDFKNGVPPQIDPAYYPSGAVPTRSSRSIRDIAVDGNTVVATDLYQGIIVYDAASGAPVKEIGHHGIPYQVSDVAPSDSHLFVASETWWGSYQETPHGYQFLKFEQMPNRIQQMKLDGDALGVADDGNIDVFSVGEPASPRKIASLQFPSRSLTRFDFDREHLAVVTEDEGLFLFQLDSSLVPSLAYQTAEKAKYSTVLVAGDTLFVGAKAGGITIYGIADASAPKALASIPTVGLVRELTFDEANAILYAAIDDDGLVAFDVKDPARPAVAGRFPAQGHIFYDLHNYDQKITAVRKRTSDGGSRINIIDFSKVSSPEIVRYHVDRSSRVWLSPGGRVFEHSELSELDNLPWVPMQ